MIQNFCSVYFELKWRIAVKTYCKNRKKICWCLTFWNSCCSCACVAFWKILTISGVWDRDTLFCSKISLEKPFKYLVIHFCSIEILKARLKSQNIFTSKDYLLAFLTDSVGLPECSWLGLETTEDQNPPGEAPCEAPGENGQYSSKWAV